MDSEHINKKMQTIMYALTKEAARFSYKEWREEWGITNEEYVEIKKIWKEKLGIKPYV